jgi:hypothetical protein
MIKAYEFESHEMLENEICDAVNALDIGSKLYVELEAPGFGPAGLPHSGAGILVVVLNPDYRNQLVAYRYEDDVFTDDWATGDSDDVAREAFARLNVMKEE